MFCEFNLLIWNRSDKFYQDQRANFHCNNDIYIPINTSNGTSMTTNNWPSQICLPTSTSFLSFIVNVSSSLKVTQKRSWHLTLVWRKYKIVFHACTCVNASISIASHKKIEEKCTFLTKLYICLFKFKDKKNLKADCKRDEPGIDTFGGTNDICCQVAKKKKIKY